MGSHPNAILMVSLTPDDLSRKTYRDILSHCDIEADDTIKIGKLDYLHKIMEEDYDKGYQISSKEGDIVVFDMVTYGYGETIKWSEFEQKKIELENWAKEICKKFRCSYEIFVTANYW